MLDSTSRREFKMDKLSVTIGKNIRRLRKQCGLKQTELAKLLYCSNTGISAWENGVNQPNAYSLMKMSEVFDCSIDEIFKEC